MEWDRQMEQLFDATSGAKLDPRLVKAAREEELKRIYQEGVYVRASAPECEGTPLKLEWVDVSKGDSNNEESHSRQRGEETMSWAKRKRICFWNIVEPPPEDEHLPGDTEPMPGS